MEPFAKRNYDAFQLSFNHLQMFKGNVLVFDTRSPDDFQAIHLPNSISVHPTDDLSLNYLESCCPDSIQRQRLSKRRRMFLLIGATPDSILFSRQIEILLRNDKCKEINLLENYNEFLRRYPFISAGYTRVSDTVNLLGYPNEIIQGFLYLGDRRLAETWDVYRNLGITHAINATKGVPNRFEKEGVKYLRVYVEDNAEVKIKFHFSRAFEFIDDALYANNNGGCNKVLVHCAQGVSRSATIVIMYLMKHFDWSYNQAFSYVKRHREIIEPNNGFMDQLLEFEEDKRLFPRSITLKKIKKINPTMSIANLRS